MSTTLDTDICIIGGGVAGLWLNARLRKAGYHTVLIERGALGGGQSVKSQGIIHGGIKYALGGKLNAATEAIADMPNRWRQCLAGEGELDLSGVRVLSQHHYLWSPGSLISNLAGFFASKALRGRVDQIKGKALPTVFNNPGFKGKVYQLGELVLDVPDVIQRLAELSGDSLISDNNPHILRDDNGEIAGIQLTGTRVRASRYVLTAGEGTEGLLQDWGVSEPAMQRRPLQMVLVKGPDLPPLYAHCLGASPKPRLTVTTHPCEDGQWCWYLGGDLAEQGVNQAPDQLIDQARRELRELLPWIDLSACQWTTLPVNRAEPAQSGLVRPDNAYVQACHNALISWPTKLALAPNLSDLVMQELTRQQVTSTGHPPLPPDLPRPRVAAPLWDACFQ
ncbi:NAD(P)/FAD-dependent oxidoreductase [Halopseudomonas aestusnigri]|uniref:Glycerol-3-phosphate dehydrogenase n=1 Tax=Halopseudomonas aestusnigri TaxID=857252 RepID=A0AAQ1G456_9GAMM|nr:FAD-dependent oxidoreductase [Halopseudomonas aestusnigri]OWL90991.1 FAD-dependent oxidoreductase [Halopseudomonas aestusnigri]SEF53045.1 Glycerol-3-phosphate dehydrogenase [Halopseudomonas aestusnigri]